MTKESGRTLDHHGSDDFRRTVKSDGRGLVRNLKCDGVCLINIFILVIVLNVSF